MTFIYQPHGVCSREFHFEIEEGIVQSFEAIGGCNGNLKGIGRLLKGQPVSDVIQRLEGVTCGFKETSCPDQIASALKEYLKNNG
ncbi:TIGR03905 family TSCPD domain-containing protein [uncultured Faecalicoccus sp.]|uniref:TIGR03905 family TSCPD domain-containing protein n=1 Tax=uncultured Faecalicoccus sp. TaxID=1971760 RepID=UPI002623FC5A|nr:TIGR03905 family TSCPD domain-containing protein [uncultured Faecalicoccus sp.]